jgi:hypothetical protein
MKEAVSMELKPALLHKAETPQKESSKLEKNIFNSQQLRVS